jgi:phosphonopyruvate decarboxylase
MIPSLDAIKAINGERQGAIIVSTMTPNRYQELVSTDPDLDVPIFGAMGKASSVALGLALARPDKRILVLDGDGGLLMNLGSLVTVAGQGPENLVHFVFEDGVYYSTGSQPVPGAGRFDLVGMAKGAGIKESHEFDDLEDFVSELPDILRKKGPVFVCLKVSHTGEGPPVYIGKTGPAMRRLAAKLREE